MSADQINRYSIALQKVFEVSEMDTSQLDNLVKTHSNVAAAAKISQEASLAALEGTNNK